MPEYKPPGDGEIVISVKRPGPDDEAAGKQLKRKRGVITPARPSTPMHRRTKKGGLIQVYDLGQRWNTSSHVWENVDFVHDPHPVVWPSPDPTHASDEIRDSNPYTISAANTLHADILSVPLADFETRYRRITPAAGNAFPVTVSISDVADYNLTSPEWTEEGLKIKSSDLAGHDLSASAFKILSGHVQGFSAIWSSYPGGRRITKLPSYSAPEEAFIPSVNDKIFLMPSVSFCYGTSFRNDAPHESTSVTFDWQIRTLPRDYANPDKLWSAEALIPPPGGSTPDFLTVLGNVASLPSVHSFKVVVIGQNFPPATGYVDRLTLTVGPVSDFPVGYDDSQPFISVGENSEGIQLVGSLMAIVKQGSQFYFFWSNTTNY